MTASIFERYGGFSSVRRVVSEFYERMLDSPVVSGYFDNTDMRRLVDHQTKFIATVMGGPASFTDETLRRVHERLAITDEAFDEMARLLRETLEDFDYKASDISAVHQEIASRRHLIVQKR